MKKVKKDKTPETQAPKTQYRIKNWSEYNKALVNRGSLTLWVDDKTLDTWLNVQKSGLRGRPYLYNDTAIEALLTIGQVFHLPLRATQGFAASLFQLLQLDFPLPDYSTLSRRSKHLPIHIQPLNLKEIKHLVIDSTGLKVFGEGEWKVRQHGVSKRRTWRKLHIAVDAQSGQITAAVLTTNDVLDHNVLPSLVESTSVPVSYIDADGAYDRKNAYQAIDNKGARALIPPRVDAAFSGKPWFAQRDDNLRQIQALGRDEWKKQSSYHQRSLSETAMFRLKTIFSDKLRSRSFDNQRTEALIRCQALNRMSALGMPDSFPLV